MQERAPKRSAQAIEVEQQPSLDWSWVQNWISLCAKEGRFPRNTYEQVLACDASGKTNLEQALAALLYTENPYHPYRLMCELALSDGAPSDMHEALRHVVALALDEAEQSKKELRIFVPMHALEVSDACLREAGFWPVAFERQREFDKATWEAKVQNEGMAEAVIHGLSEAKSEDLILLASAALNRYMDVYDQLDPLSKALSRATWERSMLRGLNPSQSFYWRKDESQVNPSYRFWLTEAARPKCPEVETCAEVGAYPAAPICAEVGAHPAVQERLDSARNSAQEKTAELRLFSHCFEQAARRPRREDLRFQELPDVAPLQGDDLRFVEACVKALDATKLRYIVTDQDLQSVQLESLLGGRICYMGLWYGREHIEEE